MNKLLSIALNDLKIALKEKGVWINLVIIPIILIFIIGLVNGGFGSTTPKTYVDVFDNDQSPLSAQFLQSVRDLSPNVVLCPLDNDEADACRIDDATLDTTASQQRVEAGFVRAIIEIPAGFEQTLLAGEPTQVIYRSSENLAQPSTLLQSVQTAITRISGASLAGRVSAFALAQGNQADAVSLDAFYQTANTIWQNPPASIKYELTTGGGDAPSGFSQSVPGMGSMYVMFTVLAGATALILERKNWTFQRMVMMPVRRWQILGGKITARFLLGMIQYSIAFGFGAVLGVRFFDNFIGVLALMIAFCLCMTALAFLIATLVKTDMQATSFTLLVVLTVAPLGGAWWPLEIVPDFMQVAAYFTPMGWVMHGYNELMLYGGGLVDIVLPVAVLLGASGALFGLA
ncbi:MAG: ABC transporter permease, partial [Anaerolineae bacterium]|nr:ABC transporter permease [Anaerolineae bacterium]